MADIDSIGYLSIRKPASTEIVRKRSRFVAFVEPAESAKEAEGILNRLREEHPGASHCCYAYRAGLRSPVVRMSDDGEPQGTAGRPILEVLERNELENTVAAVVRYFGGTLLGAAGLVRAYSGAASAAVEEAGIARYARHILLRMSVSYPGWSRAGRLLETLGAKTQDVRYGERVEADLAVHWDRADRLEKDLTDATSGDCRLSRIGERYLPLP